MAYNKTVWVDDETPLSSEHMNNIEKGIENSIEKPKYEPSGSAKYFLQKSDNETGTVWTPIDYEIDQTFNPGSTHAQSGVAINNFVSENSVGKKVETEVGGTTYVCEIFNDYDNNIASGNLSHTEGKVNTSKGIASHAEGSRTSALTNYSHSEGYRTSATGSGSHAEGSISVSDSDKNDWYAKWSLENGYAPNSIVYNEDTDKDGESVTRLYISLSEIKPIDNRDIHDTLYWRPLGAIGGQSHSEGRNCGAVGSYSHAEGRRCYAFGSESHAEGYCSSAFGAHSHVEGANDRSVLYNENTFYPKFSTVSLEGSRSYPTYIAIQDVPAKTTGENAPPNETYWRIVGAYSYGAHCEGGRNYIGATKNADGSYNQGSSSSSHAEGVDNIILPTSTRDSTASHAEGSQNHISSSYAHAEGYNNVVSGQSAHVGGSYNIATKHNQTVIGVGNENKEDTLFEVGSGRVTESTNDFGVTTIDVTRKNAFEVTKDGKIRLQKFDSYDSTNPIGYSTLKCVNGALMDENGQSVDSPISFGTGTDSAVQKNSDNVNVAKGERSFAVNRKTKALGKGSFSANYSTQAGCTDEEAPFYKDPKGQETARYQAAFNNGSKARGDSSFATGINTQANGIASFSGGTGSQADGSDDVALGNTCKTNLSSILSEAPKNPTPGGNPVNPGSTPSSTDKTLRNITKMGSLSAGNVNISNGPGSVALGQQSVAIGDSNFANGYRALAGLKSYSNRLSAPIENEYYYLPDGASYWQIGSKENNCRFKFCRILDFATYTIVFDGLTENATVTIVYAENRDGGNLIKHLSDVNITPSNNEVDIQQSSLNGCNYFSLSIDKSSDKFTSAYIKNAPTYNMKASDDVDLSEDDAIAFSTTCFSNGFYTTANGPSSVAFNNHTTASHNCSSAFGFYTHTTNDNQFVCGKFNATQPTTEKQLFTVGGGTIERPKTVFSVLEGDLDNAQIKVGNQYLSESEIANFKSLDAKNIKLIDYTFNPSDNLKINVTLPYLNGAYPKMDTFKTLTIILQLGNGVTSTHTMTPSMSSKEHFVFSTASGDIFGTTFYMGEDKKSAMFSVPKYVEDTLVSVQVYGKNV